jgi:hypothetical protein
VQCKTHCNMCADTLSCQQDFENQYALVDVCVGTRPSLTRDTDQCCMSERLGGSKLEEPGCLLC